MGTFTFNLCQDVPDAKYGAWEKLPTTGKHDLLDIIPHKKYDGYPTLLQVLKLDQSRKALSFLDIWRKSERGERRRELS